MSQHKEEKLESEKVY